MLMDPNVEIEVQRTVSVLSWASVRRGKCSSKVRKSGAEAWWAAHAKVR